jgi:branched-chain amino acid transport system ATP-binding protein
MENVLLATQSHERMKFVFYRNRISYGSLYEKAGKILREWGFWEKRHTLAQNLSHGEQRQLDIILSLVEEPKLLLLDEPTAGLSRAETTAVAEIIQTLSQDRTILMIEHDMEVAFSLAKRITVLHQGRIFADGSPDEIRGDPRVREIYLGEEE